MIFREIAFGSEDFHAEVRLRNEVLRLPLGLDVHDEDLEAEKGQRHFGLFSETGEILACVIAIPLSPTEAKIRQMAVAPSEQGKGFGRKVIQHLEAELARRGLINLSLNVRAAVVPFYEKLGYRRVGAEFVEVGIPHRKMEKHLPAR